MVRLQACRSVVQGKIITRSNDSNVLTYIFKFELQNLSDYSLVKVSP